MSKYISQCLFKIGEDLNTREVSDLMEEFTANPTQDVAAELVSKITKMYSDTLDLNDVDDQVVEKLFCDLTKIKWSTVIENKEALDKDTIFQINGLTNVIDDISNVDPELQGLLLRLVADIDITGDILELIIRHKVLEKYPMVDPEYVLVQSTDEGVNIRLHVDIEERKGSEGVVDFINDISNDILQDVIRSENNYDSPTSPLN